jgi:hypothetical protein
MHSHCNEWDPYAFPGAPFMRPGRMSGPCSARLSTESLDTPRIIKEEPNNHQRRAGEGLQPDLVLAKLQSPKRNSMTPRNDRKVYTNPYIHTRKLFGISETRVYTGGEGGHCRRVLRTASHRLKVSWTILSGATINAFRHVAKSASCRESSLFRRRSRTHQETHYVT